MPIENVYHADYLCLQCPNFELLSHAVKLDYGHAGAAQYIAEAGCAGGKRCIPWVYLLGMHFVILFVDAVSEDAVGDGTRFCSKPGDLKFRSQVSPQVAVHTE